MSTQVRSRDTEDALAAVLGDHPGAAAEPPPAETLEVFDTEAPVEADADADAWEETADPADDELPHDEDAPRTARRQRRTDQVAPAAGSGGLASALGAVLLLGAGALGAMTAQGSAPAELANFGVTPGTLLAVGAVTLGVGLVRRQVARTNQQVTAFSQEQGQLAQDLHSGLQQLLERHAGLDGKPVAEGEELERVFVALTRQDEKINNLSRALKMYGKPLMEIANHGSDVAGHVNQLKEHVDAVLETCRQGFERVASAASSGGISAEALAGLQQQLVRIEAGITAVGQRLDDSEVRKSLLRLEDAEKAQQQVLAHVARADAVQQSAQRIEQRIDGGLGKLETALGQLKSGEISGLDATVRDMQRELSGIATAMAQLQQTVKKAAMAAPAAPRQMAPTAAPAAPTPAAPGASAAPAAAPTGAPTTAAAPAKAAGAAPAGGTEDAAAGVAQNQVGSRATSGKNVLGAIAKLKKMKN